MDDILRVRQSVDWLRSRGAKTVALASQDGVADPAGMLRDTGADDWVAAEGVAASAFSKTPAEIDVDAVCIVDKANFPNLMRQLERIAYKNKVIIPADPDWVVNPWLKTLTMETSAWRTGAVPNYLARNGFKGNYLEFGTFWGWQFFPMSFSLRPILEGKCYAFDSFAGLSKPMDEEVTFTGGDFVEGAYACNQPSFEAIADLVEFPRDRLRVVPGFFSESLVGKTGADYGIEPRSVSYCVIDCDIYEPTVQVLDFVFPLLDDGALLYFDDWRLGRGSPRSGERGAALDWLKRHPEIELLDFPGDANPNVGSWQHAWFIFHRRPERRRSWFKRFSL